MLRKGKRWGLPAYWVGTLLYWELLAHWGLFPSFGGSWAWTLGFSAALALALAALTGLLPEKAGFVVSLILSLGLIILYGSEIVYNSIFGTPYSVSQMGLGADALQQFWREALAAVGDCLPLLAALFLPAAVLIVLHRAGLLGRPGRLALLALAVAAAALALATRALISQGGSGMFSDEYFLTDSAATTTQRMERFGVPATFLLELTQSEDAPEESALLSAQTPATSPTAAAEETQPQETQAPEITYNVLSIDFDALNAATEDEYLLALNAYCAQRQPTNQNAYTGALKDYNLILICAESFSPAAIDPELTPTLYKLANEGFVFKNYYNSFPNTTINGEYALLQGLFPDSARSKENSSMLASANNSVPFALGNMFLSQRGIQSLGYHNNIGSYYSRNKSHPNLGYEMKFNKDGMSFSSVWPTSDLEMMEQSVDDYIGQEQFHAYYMTFSGHYPYDASQNNIARRNYDLVENLEGYTAMQKSYLSCNIELDKAMEYLLERLEEAGVADKTAIVLAADHTPYGLTHEQYFEMLDEEEDDLAWYKSTLIFWVGDMEEPVEVEQYCCNIDILPTILNLWGFEYDSRLLAGTDVFSDGPHAAILADHSFLTDTVWFNADTGEIRYPEGEDAVPENYVEEMNQRIAGLFDFSAQVLRKDYYGFVFGDEE